MNDLRPNSKEIVFLDLAYNKFYELFEEILDTAFLSKDKCYRFCKIKQIFLIYNEILNYEPIRWVIKEMKHKRPPMESEIASELFKFIRNTLEHFPFFDSWDEVWVNNLIVNWHKDKMTMDRFLSKYNNKNAIKYRIWNSKNKTMTYLEVGFPKEYDTGKSVFLKDIISEKEGVMFSLVLMKQVIDTQILT